MQWKKTKKKKKTKRLLDIKNVNCMHLLGAYKHCWWMVIIGSFAQCTHTYSVRMKRLFSFLFVDQFHAYSKCGFLLPVSCVDPLLFVVSEEGSACFFLLFRAHLLSVWFWRVLWSIQFIDGAQIAPKMPKLFSNGFLKVKNHQNSGKSGKLS